MMICHRSPLVGYGTVMTGCAKILNFAFSKNEEFCIKITLKRGIVYQNHTKTGNCVLNLMNFAGVVLEQLQVWVEQVSSVPRSRPI